MTSYSSSSSLAAAGQQQTSPSLRQLQKKALLKVLNLNQEEQVAELQQPNDLLPEVVGGEPVWKFLVFDKMGQDVISSVLRVSDLREAGVTVHMQLKSDRQQMEDVPASSPFDTRLTIVYLLEPTAENVNIIADVCLLL
jgi:sec1 family domain-containing protein 1